MTENDKLIEHLILKHVGGEPLTGEEQAMLDEWRQQSAEQYSLPDKFRDAQWVQENLIKLSQVPSSQIWERISEQVKNEKQHSRRFIGRIIKKSWYYPAAAAALLFFMFKLFVPLRQSKPAKAGTAMTAGHRANESSMASLASLSASAAAAVAGHYKEILTLEDGLSIDIGNAPEGTLAFGERAGIRKTSGNQLEYRARSGSANDVSAYHTLATGLTKPFGLVLPDGSKVWLSNASALCYPSAFMGAHRIVRLTGEACFEIAKDRSKPFIVETANGSTEVLGTRFNVMAYADDPVGRVTLLEGSIKVNNGKASVTLRQPLQQVQLTRDGLRLQQLKNSAGAIAWQNGSFHFDGTDLKTAMRELARWYHKTVTFPDEVQGVPIEGDLGRDMQWRQVVDALRKFENGYARFTVVGDNISVSAPRSGN